MTSPRILFFSGLMLLSAFATAADSGFLTSYDNLTPQTSAEGSDLIYASPKGESALAAYESVMVDQPEIHFSSDSQYKGLKPVDVEAIAAILRDALVARLQGKGYDVVEVSGPNTLYLRTAMTELYLKKKKRGLLSYTPAGAVAKVGMDAIKDTLEKVDIIEMNVEAEVQDSVSGEVLGAVVLERGHRKDRSHKEERLDMEELRATVDEYGARFACRLDNAKLPAEQRVDCYDPEARAAQPG